MFMNWKKLWPLGLVVLAGAGYFIWQASKPPEVPTGFAKTHGRLEATRVTIAAKTPGRLAEVLVREGDSVEAGQVVAKMDTRTLQAQLRQAQANVQRAKDAKVSATAVVAQRASEWELARKQYARTAQLRDTGAVSNQEIDVSQSQVETTRAASEAAKSAVIQAQSEIDAAVAEVERLKVEIDDCTLVAPIHGRIQYRLAEPGEVLASGGRVLDMIDLTDVYMILYLPEAEAGRTAIGAEARLIFDAAPNLVAPAKVSYVSAEAQFTPKTVETASERQKLAFQVRVRLDAELLRRFEPFVKTGVPGEVFIRLDPSVEWPANLQSRLPDLPAESKK
jgi:HlyD family secretion protein